MGGTLEAPRALRRRHEKIKRQDGLRAFLAAVKANPVQQQLPGKKRRPKAPPEPSEKLGVPTAEREAKALEVSSPNAPPFNSQILGAAQKFAKQLGPEAMLILEQFYRVGVKGSGSRGLTASYDGHKVDTSRAGYEHLSVAEQDAHESFRIAMQAMPPELRAYALEMVMEEGSPRKPAEIGTEISGYTDERRGIGAAVATLKIIAWCVREHLNMEGRRAKNDRSKRVCGKHAKT